MHTSLTATVVAMAGLASVTANAACPTDLDGTGATDIDDLTQFLSNWNQPGATDFDGDGVTDFDDLSQMLAGWGACGSDCTDLAPWTYVVIPDTQYFTVWANGGSPEMFYSQTQWIADSADSLNTRFVSHLGDIVEFGAEDWQWEFADAAMQTLDGVRPYGMTFGNHDADDYIWGRSDIKYNNWFPRTRYDSQTWYGDGFPEGKNTNSWQTFTAGCADYLVLHLQWDPPADVRSWADGVLAAHPDHRVIVSTHEFPGNYVLWNEVLIHHANVFMVVSGHECARERHLPLMNDAGNTVHTILSDYQCDNPSQALLRYYVFNPADDSVEAVTYSPWNDTYETDADSSFVFIAEYGTSSQGCDDVAPYGGTPHTVPGRIQAEHYDEGCEGYAFHDLDAFNEGGAFRQDGVDLEPCTGDDYNLGWTRDGEWVRYSVDVDATGEFMLDLRVASDGDGSTIHLHLDGTPLSGQIDIDPTGGWQSWTTNTTGPFNLDAGQHTVTLHTDDGDYNLDWMEFRRVP